MTSTATTTYSSAEESAVLLARYDVTEEATTDAPTHSMIINQYAIGTETVKVTGISSMTSYGNG